MNDAICCCATSVPKHAVRPIDVFVDELPLRDFGFKRRARPRWTRFNLSPQPNFVHRLSSPLTHGTPFQLGDSLTAKLNANLALYANADYEFAVGNTNDVRRGSVRGTVASDTRGEAYWPASFQRAGPHAT
jgi:hypothetical protein